MTGFRVKPASMAEQSTKLDQVTQALSTARGEAAVPIAEGAFGRLAESQALHAAFRSCTEQVIRCLDEGATELARAADGVATVARNYEELDRRGADKLAAVGRSTELT